jgi:hypothetical protein
MPSRSSTVHDKTPSGLLERAVQRALAIAKKARKHRQKLTSDNFYGNKLAEIRADAVNAFRDLQSRSAGDTTAMAELIQTVFSAEAGNKDRAQAARDLTFSLRTTWRNQPTQSSSTDEGLFPLQLLVQANRGYLVTVGRQMNGCFNQGWYDACAVMMRRLIEIAIIEAFEHHKIANKIKGADGNYIKLSELVALAVNEAAWSLSRNSRKYLPQLRDVGHMSAHGRYWHATKDDIGKVSQGARVVIEEFLHHAGLL